MKSKKKAPPSPLPPGRHAPKKSKYASSRDRPPSGIRNTRSRSSTPAPNEDRETSPYVGPLNAHPLTRPLCDGVEPTEGVENEPTAHNTRSGSRAGRGLRGGSSASSLNVSTPPPRAHHGGAPPRGAGSRVGSEGPVASFSIAEEEPYQSTALEEAPTDTCPTAITGADGGMEPTHGGYMGGATGDDAYAGGSGFDSRESFQWWELMRKLEEYDSLSLGGVSRLSMKEAVDTIPRMSWGWVLELIEGLYRAHVASIILYANAAHESILGEFVGNHMSMTLSIASSWRLNAWETLKAVEGKIVVDEQVGGAASAADGLDGEGRAIAPFTVSESLVADWALKNPKTTFGGDMKKVSAGFNQVWAGLEQANGAMESLEARKVCPSHTRARTR